MEKWIAAYEEEKVQVKLTNYGSVPTDFQIVKVIHVSATIEEITMKACSSILTYLFWRNSKLMNMQDGVHSRWIHSSTGILTKPRIRKQMRVLLQWPILVLLIGFLMINGVVIPNGKVRFQHIKRKQTHYHLAYALP
ncbi:uncharacterized protein LOC113281935 isoform X2 [Papaver somniferum]|uniref:uncharacterized protein LOC113281935 isoform X2 n=1 Tax=Papaver somniferum TaxID=3469 RepID=UPI000E6FB348|nr:uncharacterized protein LOC113281935 isoform X2 [Papaver somniferum]